MGYNGSPIIIVYCVLHNFCDIKNDIRIVHGIELEDATSNDINLNIRRRPICEQATSRAGNRIREENLKRS